MIQEYFRNSLHDEELNRACFQQDGAATRTTLKYLEEVMMIDL